jgi:hypothetical protein
MRQLNAPELVGSLRAGDLSGMLDLLATEAILQDEIARRGQLSQRLTALIG